jgi:hypothetical protein
VERGQRALGVRAGAAPVFHPLPPPTDEEIAEILEQIHERVTRLLRRGGRLPEDPSPTDPVAEQMPLRAGYAAPRSCSRACAGRATLACSENPSRRAHRGLGPSTTAAGPTHGALASGAGDVQPSPGAVRDSSALKPGR